MSIWDDWKTQHRDRIIRISAARSKSAKTLASVVLQAVFVPGDKTDQGTLIQAIAPPWFEIIQLLNENPNLAHEIGHRKWEEIVAASYEAAGFDEVTLTPSSGDRGRDVIAVRKGLFSIRIIDQVKAYKPGHLVTAEEVRALLGVLSSDQSASKGIVSTTSDFAPKISSDPTITPFLPTRLELLNGKSLLERLKELADQTSRRVAE